MDQPPDGITVYPQRDPETGAMRSNFETLPDDIISGLRRQGFTDDEIATMELEVHTERIVISDLLRLLLAPPHAMRGDPEA